MVCAVCSASRLSQKYSWLGDVILGLLAKVTQPHRVASTQACAITAKAKRMFSSIVSV